MAEITNEQYQPILNQHLVTLRGRDFRCASWRRWVSLENTDLTGVIIECGGQKYIIGPRNHLLACRTVDVFYPISLPPNTVPEKNTKPKPNASRSAIMMQTVEPIFQLWDLALMIYVSVDKTEFDPNCGELITDNYVPGMVCSGFDILNHGCPIPVRKQVYKVAFLDLAHYLNSVRFHVKKYDVIFNLTNITSRRELAIDKMPVHNFGLRLQPKQASRIFYGSPVLDKEGNLFGIVTRHDGDSLAVMPTKLVTKLVKDYLSFRSRPEKYFGFVNKPFDYNVENGVCTISRNCKVPTFDGTTKLIRKGDIITEIDGYPIEIYKHHAQITDPDIGRPIDIDMFIRMNYDNLSPFVLALRRGSKTTTVRIFGINSDSKVIDTDPPFFHPRGVYPHVNYKGIIMVQLTHELIFTLSHVDKAIIDNELVGRSLRGVDRIQLQPAVIIVDSLNLDVAYHHDLPQLHRHQKKHLDCPIVHKINDKRVKTLDEARNALIEDSDNTLVFNYNIDLKPGCGTTLKL